MFLGLGRGRGLASSNRYYLVIAFYISSFCNRAQFIDLTVLLGLTVLYIQTFFSPLICF